MVLKNHETKMGTIRKFRFPDDGWCSFYGPISADPEETLELASDYLWRNNNDHVDVAEFTILPEYIPEKPPEIERKVNQWWSGCFRMFPHRQPLFHSRLGILLGEQTHSEKPTPKRRTVREKIG